MKKKNVFIVINSLEFGGIQKSLIGFLKCIKEKAEVDLLVWDHDTGVKVPDWVNILEIPTVYSVQKALKKCGLFSYSTFLSLLAASSSKRWKFVAAPKKKYDIAIAYSHVGISKYFVIDKVKADKKYTFYHNGAYSFGEEIKRVDKEYYEKYDVVYAVSDHIKKLLHHVLSQDINIEVLHNLIDREEITASSKDACPEMDSAQGLKLLTVGRLSEEKNPLAIVEVAKELRNIGIAFKWFVVGDGVLRQKLQNKIDEYQLAEQCVLCGSQSNPYKYMTRCDVYVQLSKYEAEPVTVQEVAVFGKPMVLSSIEGFYRYSMIFKNIVLVEIEPKRIAEAIATNSKNMTDNRVELEKIEESTLGKIRLMLD